MLQVYDVQVPHNIDVACNGNREARRRHTIEKQIIARYKSFDSLINSETSNTTMFSTSDIITVRHSASGASCRIHPFDATVMSYIDKSGRETLFLSKLAKLDGSKAIRGGIPLVFPIFGPPNEKGSTMPQHGYARQNNWTVKESSKHDSEEHAGIVMTLDLANASAGRGTNNTWAPDQARTDGTDCRLLLDVKVDATSLTTTLQIQNTGTDAFTFNCLQHTYFKVEDKAAQTAEQCFVKGLDGYSLVDKVDSNNNGQVVPKDQAITLSGEVDRVYTHPEGKQFVQVTIGVGDNKTVKMEAFGEVADAPVPVSCVVWNPSVDKAKSMSDFGDDQYQEMICVEPGLLGHQPVLPPGKEARFTQIIYS